MKLLARILNRIVFVRADFVSGGEYRISVHILQGGRLSEADWEQAKGVLAVVVIAGCGVVTKSDDSEAAMRVRADGETFLCSSCDGRTSFVRRVQMQVVEEELAVHKIVPALSCVAAAESDFGATADACAAQVYAGLRWRSLFRPADENSAAAQALVRRLALPVLGVFLTLLTANSFLSPRLNARRQTLQTELAARQHSASESETLGARQRNMLSEFAARPAVARAAACDRIARAVPERVTLTALEVEPPTKRFEADKPFGRREGAAVVCGTASSAADISLFAVRLSELSCIRDVRLRNVEKQRDGDRLAFRIEMKL